MRFYTRIAIRVSGFHKDYNLEGGYLSFSIGFVILKDGYETTTTSVSFNLGDAQSILELLNYS